MAPWNIYLVEPKMYQYTLKWDVPMDNSIKAGDRAYCNENLYMDDGRIAFIEGKSYLSNGNGCLDSEIGEGHILTDWKHSFTKIPHPVETCGCDTCKDVMEKQKCCGRCNGIDDICITDRDKDYFQSVQEEYGNKRTFDTGAVRDSNEGKPLIHTLLGYTRQRFGYHMAKNAKKYGPLNFLKGIPTEAALESLDRHLAAYMAGDRSEDHLAALIFNVQLIIMNEKREEGIEANHYFK